jgi:hypothetical protein
MKNVLLLLSILCFVACQEEKPKKIVFDTNLKCSKPKEYRVQAPNYKIKVDSTKMIAIKKI